MGKRFHRIVWLGPVGGFLLWPELALALQVHPAPTGLYAHQIAHAFFTVSMGILVYWLQERRLVERRGWRYIQLSALCFILWNLGAMAGHVIDSYLTEEAFVGQGWKTALVAEKAILPNLYYLLQMDHLICVPAMALLFLGLRQFRREIRDPKP